jgi:hypothetical protein
MLERAASTHVELKLRNFNCYVQDTCRNNYYYYYYLFIYLFSHQYPICIPLFPIRATFPAHLVLLDLIILIILGDVNTTMNLLIHKSREFIGHPSNFKHFE